VIDVQKKKMIQEIKRKKDKFKEKKIHDLIKFNCEKDPYLRKKIYTPFGIQIDKTDRSIVTVVGIPFSCNREASWFRDLEKTTFFVDKVTTKTRIDDSKINLGSKGNFIDILYDYIWALKKDERDTLRIYDKFIVFMNTLMNLYVRHYGIKKFCDVVNYKPPIRKIKEL
jgi:hypothetical protein